MANQNNLGIRITADLKRDESVDDINKSLRFIEGQVRKLDLGVDFGKISKQFNQQVNKMDVSKAENKMEDLVDVPVEKIRKENEKLGKAIDQVQKDFNGKLKSIQIVEDPDIDGRIDKAVVSLKDYNNQLSRTVTLKNEGLVDRKSNVYDDDFTKSRLTEHQDLEKVMKESQNEVNKLEKEFKDLEDAQEKYIKNIEKMRIKGNITNEDAGVLTDYAGNSQSFDELNKLDLTMEELKQSQRELNKEKREEIQLTTQRNKKEKEYSDWWNKELTNQRVKQEKLNESEKERTENLRHQIELAQKQARLKVQNLMDRNSKNMTDQDKNELNNYVKSMEAIDATTPKARQQIQMLNHEFKQTSSRITTASQKAMGFGSKLKEALNTIPLWMAGMTINKRKMWSINFVNCWKPLKLFKLQRNE